MPLGAIYAGRPGPYGNPFFIGKEYQPGKLVTPENNLLLFEAYARDRLKREPHWLEPLRDVELVACWCKLTSPCHVDILLKLLKDGMAQHMSDVKP